MIGDNIEVTVVDIRGDKVRLGIDAPKDKSVHRREVYDAIKRENRQAAQVASQNNKGLPPLTTKKPSQAETPTEDQPPNELVEMAAKYGYKLVKAA
jgi:carbon storage regulator